jgi:HPt (histidine-containing phosphotransfer) domain-containing protein
MSNSCEIGSQQSSTPSPNAAAEPAFDLAALRERLEEDLDLIDELVQLFLSTAPALLGDVERAASAGDRSGLERAAHTLKGAARNLCAEPCARIALELEMLGRNGATAEATPLVDQLRCELDRVTAAFKQADLGASA